MISLELDLSNWDKRFAEYFKLTTRTADEVLNTKAYYIARNAVQETHHADKSEIRKELLTYVTGKSGKSGPRAALIINALRKKNGLKGLNGAAMAVEVEKLIKSRQNKINFLRAGWIPAIKELKPLIDKSYKGYSIGGDFERMARGVPKGGADPAIGNSLRSEVNIYNSIKEDTRPPRVIAFLTAGLQKAVDKEVASMEEYINKKLGETADKSINKP